MVGINLSRYFSILNGTTLSIDNVTSDTTCTVSAVSSDPLFTNVDGKYYKYEGKTFI